uniref:Carboxylic ester hydrolase n=2 Tax=Wickerhamomyces anomalus TaxID=4927 RepID=H6UWN7_WICAO|nr:putative esterase [Wickerhamomyces anomalus]
MLFNIIAITALIPIASTAPITATSSPPIVQIQNGSIQGDYLEKFNQDVFLGIPYAQPPLGSLRFKPPQSFNDSWNGTKIFNQYSDACIASGASDNKLLPQSENCLTVNVVKPHGVGNENLPVAIWIYGGGFQDGSSSRPAYNLSYIVQNGVEIGKPFIGVSFNYRLSGLGFLGGQEVVNKGFTNVGLRDQIQAIHWIHENIHQFGGDSDHLVIWGESAGAISVSKLLSSNQLGDYIKGAIIESGPALFPNITSGANEARQIDYNTLSTYFNCSEATDSLECLQYVDINELFHVFNVSNGVLQTGFRYPYIDGDIIPKSSYQILSDDQSLRVPLLIGTSTDEGSQFVPKNLNTTEELKEFLKGAFPSLTDSSINKLDELYPIDDPLVSTPLDPSSYSKLPISYPPTFGAQYPRLATLYGDLVFFGQSRIMSKFYSQKSPVYKYRFNIPDLETSNQSYYGAGHFQEVVYVFDNDQAPIDTSSGATWNPSPKSPAIAESISKIWVNFIADLNPNVDQTKIPIETPEWPEYKDGEQNMVFDLNGFYLEKDDKRAQQIEFIESINSQLNS